MSEGRRICVCGKDGTKGPVVITITTCKHNTPPIIEGANVCMSSPLATSTPRDSQEDPKSANQKKDHDSRSSKGNTEQSPDVKSISNERSSHPEGSLGKTSMGENIKDDTAYTTALDETVLETTTDETAFESAVDETAFKSALDENVQDTTADSTVDDTAGNTRISDISDGQINDTTEVTESEINDSTEVNGNETNMSENTGNETTGVTNASVVSENETTNESEYHSAGESAEVTEDVANKDKGEPMVILLAETAVNTLPFLDNLFWPPKYATTKVMPTSSGDQEICMIELLMFEKHSKNCRQNLNNISRENLFFDGTAFLHSIGRMSYPICSDVQKTESGESRNTENGYKPDSEKSLDRCKKIFQSFERHIRNEQFFDDNKSLTQFDKNAKDCAVQFESNFIRAPKWYDGFLICFGLKPNEDMYYIEDDDNTLSDNSSSLITKYLRI